MLASPAFSQCEAAAPAVPGGGGARGSAGGGCEAALCPARSPHSLARGSAGGGCEAALCPARSAHLGRAAARVGAAKQLCGKRRSVARFSAQTLCFSR